MTRTLYLVSLFVALLAMIGYYMRRERSCRDEFITLEDGFSKPITIDVCRVFSQDYVQARQRFREAATKTGAQLARLPVYHQDNNNYTIDIAVIRGTQPGLVIHMSGVHGMEGYPGSAIQIALLEALLLGGSGGEEQESPTLILVHAFNPVGMATFRRVNEHNVDLNRNGVKNWSTVSNYFNKETYDKFDALFNPRRAPTCFSIITFALDLIWAIGQHGLPTLKQALVGGQYHNPRGVFYGGQATEPSLLLLKQWLETYLLKEKNTTTTGVITWLDVHTGLGPHGEDTMLPGGIGLVQDKANDVGREIAIWFPTSHNPFNETSVVAAKVAQGYQGVQGTTADYFYETVSDKNVLLLAQEFGTIPGALVGYALMVENAAYQYLPSDQALVWAKRTLQPAFYPNNPTWRRRILDRGVHAVLQCMKRSVQYSTNSSR